MSDAFDADVLIYAASPSHPLGDHVRRLFAGSDGRPVGVGSTLLLPELLSKPRRLQALREMEALESFVGKLVLVACDEAVAGVAVTLGARYGLRAPDAVHLATAVTSGARRFITNNRHDFPRSIDVIEITYPEDLPVPTTE